ncbi:type II secretion system protein GspE, partial [bacterium]|nr:type II secretion system protein GspE [bacterium]
RGKGCSLCNDKGMKGRLGIFEILIITPKIQELISRKASPLELREVAAKEGWHSLKFAAIRKLIRLETSIEEVMKAAEQ